MVQKLVSFFPIDSLFFLFVDCFSCCKVDAGIGNTLGPFARTGDIL